MASELPDSLLYEGVVVDVSFGDRKPMYGDLYRICDDVHPNFPPTGEFGFEGLAELQFSQVDDYFGVRSLSDEGDDVPIWLYPLVAGETVHHHAGPFDGVRLTYSVLRNPSRRAAYYLACLEAFASIGAGARSVSRGLDLGTNPDFASVRDDIDAVIASWRERKVEVGSTDALLIDF